MASLKDAKNRIKELISEGYSKIEAIRALKDEGFHPGDVDKAMGDVVDGDVPDSAPAPSEEEQQLGPIPEPPKPPEAEKKESVPVNIDFLREMEPLRQQIEENRRLIEENTARDKENLRKLRAMEVEDVVKFQTRLEKMHEELKNEFNEISKLKEVSKTDRLTPLRDQIEDNENFITCWIITLESCFNIFTRPRSTCPVLISN